METQLMIGSDPEFMLYREKRINLLKQNINTHDYEWFSKNNKIGYEIQRANTWLTTNTTFQIGTDGCSSIGELRPDPKNDPLEHTDEIERLLTELYKVLIPNKLKIRAGNGYRFALGGHIHFNKKFNHERKHNKNYYLVNVMDLLSLFYLNFQDKREFKTRIKNYGRLSAYETKSYGFEYRTLSSWLGTRAYTKGTLCLAYVLAYEFLNNNRHIAKMLRTSKTMLGKHLETIYYNFDLKKIDIFSNYFIKNIRKCSLYPKYKGHIETIFSFYALDKKTKDFDILANWNIKETKQEDTYKDMFKFNENDLMIEEIKKAVKNHKIKENKAQIRIYGLIDRPDYNLKTNIGILLNKVLASKRLSKTFKCANAVGGNYYIAFSKQVRTDNLKEVIDLINYVSKNYDKMNLREIELSYNMVNREAQTDTREDE